MGVRGLVFDVKHFAVHDGPGIRTTIFLKGCPLRCMWCHSPESQSPEPEILFNPDLCIGCGACVETCPKGAQTKSPDKIVRDLCIRCGRCAEACYSGALTKIGGWVTVDEMISEVEKDKVLYSASGGGVTLSGGEPAAQAQFALALLRSLKERGYHTTLETCGHATWKTMEALLRNVDLVLFDLKHMDPIIHKELTGVSNELILSNLEKVGQLEHPSLIVRIPVIPTINDSGDNVKAMAEFLRGLRNLDGVELLPYHQLGAPKYESIGREYQLCHLTPPTLDELKAISDALTSRGLRVIIEGVE